MSIISYAIRGQYRIERNIETGVDDAGASIYDYRDIIGSIVWGFAQPVGTSQSAQVILGEQQESRLLYRFYCLPGIDIKRGDRITRVDSEYPVLHIINVQPMQNIQAVTDHLVCLCEEFQQGEKLR